ncbi:hypothetical protein CTI12_AA447450 [Artemisia annua]|uniref:RRM domain-containing protein n=1 Tax=Artemisia annua TaxID=35608 RepID=A0A2U1L2J7_ARTAN|nr:hypothetical protein CTI12_AA447450 [Artemisia annua]
MKSQMDDVERIATSFYVTNFPISLDAKNLWKEFQPFGRIVDAFIANKRSKQGKRFGVIRFLGVHNEEVFAKSLSNIWIGSYHMPRTTHDRPIFSTNSTANFPPKKSYASVAHGDMSSKDIRQTFVDNVKSIQLGENDLIKVDDTTSVVLVKVKEIDTISNMYRFTSSKSCEAFKSNESLKILWTSIKVPSPSFVVDERMIWIEISGLPLCAWGSSAYKKVANLFGRFNFFDDDAENSMSTGRACIATKLQSIIFEKVNVTINGVKFQAHVKEIGTWSMHISNDTESNDSNDDCNFDERRSTNENVLEEEFVSKTSTHVHHSEGIIPPGIKLDSTGNDEITPQAAKVGDSLPLDPITKEHIVSQDNKLAEEDTSELSKPPGFENFFNENKDCSRTSNTSRSGKCSTSFGNYKRKELKGFSFIDEMNRMIEVGGALGYDVKGCKKSLRRMINGIGVSIVDQ